MARLAYKKTDYKAPPAFELTYTPRTPLADELARLRREYAGVKTDAGGNWNEKILKMRGYMVFCIKRVVEIFETGKEGAFTPKIDKLNRLYAQKLKYQILIHKIADELDLVANVFPTFTHLRFVAEGEDELLQLTRLAQKNIDVVQDEIDCIIGEIGLFSQTHNRALFRSLRKNELKSVKKNKPQNENMEQPKGVKNG